jgi:hypothetical protein
MDEADMAQAHMEREASGFLAQRKPEPVGTGPQFANGRCWCCQAIVARGLRWCDSICRDDWEKTQ